MSELLLIKQAATGLSKKQQQFNKLIQAIDSKRKQLTEMKNRLDHFTIATQKELANSLKEYSDVLLQLMHILDKHHDSGTLKKEERQKTIQMLLNISRSVTSHGENLAVFKALVAKYSELLQNSMSRKEREMGEEQLKQMYSAAFGVEPDEDINFSNFDDLGEKHNQKINEDRQRQQQEQFSNLKNKAYSGFNKKLSEKAALLQKSWKTLYTKLVKKLHPDIEPNEEKKLHKTAILQQVTLAYEKKDFYTLLNLYQQQVGFDTETEEKDNKLQNDEALGQYIVILKKQDGDLKGQLDTLQFAAAGHGLPFLFDKEAHAYFDTFLKKEKRELRSRIIAVKEDLRSFRDLHIFRKIIQSFTKDSLMLDDVFEDELYYDDPFEHDSFEKTFKKSSGKKHKGNR